MKINFPQNMKEALIMSLPNCTTMVLGMMTLNLWIYGALTWGHFFAALPRIYITAFALDFFIIGPLVMRIVRKYNIQRFMPLIRVGMMAGILTFLAPIIETGYMPSGLRYIIALPRNYIVALLLQVAIAFPFGNYCLGKWRMLFKGNVNVKKQI